MISAFKTLGGYNSGFIFASSELIGYVDLTDSYEMWPKCSLVINAFKCVRLSDIPNAAPFIRSPVAKIGKYSIRQVQNTFSSATNMNIVKASHTFVVYHLLIDIVQFVWSCVRLGRQVIQFSKQCLSFAFEGLRELSIT